MGRDIVAEPMRHLPNIICLLRIALIWPIVASLAAGEYRLTLLLFVLAAASDGLDGWLAKRFGWASRLGKFLDPLADKLLLVSVFLVLCWLHRVPAYLGVIAVGRDVMIGLGAVVYRIGWGALHGRPILASKINTLLQILYLSLVVLRAGFGQPPLTVIDAMAVAVTLTVLVSGAAYLRDFTGRALQIAGQG
jgi:cardiolipin synthase (CMP-forming)